jgi:3-oxoacyl-[acyl-carrier protein] reductase
MPDLSGQRVVVTGAGRGLGHAVARAALRAGAVVGAGYRQSESGVAALVSEFADRVRPLRFDVRDSDAVLRAAREFAEKHGHIQAWVNAAGVNRPGLLLNARPEALQEMVDTNLWGAIHAARAVLPAMLEHRGGVIVNVSSVAARRPTRGQAVYAATKGAVESLTRALAVEYGRKGIRVLCVRPGPIDTDMLSSTRALAEADVLARLPLRRLGQADEVAALTVFLLSADAGFITGSVHAVDGGYVEP